MLSEKPTLGERGREDPRYLYPPCMLLSALPQVTHLPPWKRQWLGSANITSTKTL